MVKDGFFGFLKTELVVVYAGDELGVFACQSIQLSEWDRQLFCSRLTGSLLKCRASEISRKFLLHLDYGVTGCIKFEHRCSDVVLLHNIPCTTASVEVWAARPLSRRPRCLPRVLQTTLCSLSKSSLPRFLWLLCCIREDS